MQVHQGTDMTADSNAGSKDMKSFKGWCDWQSNIPKAVHILSIYKYVCLHSTERVNMFPYMERGN